MDKINLIYLISLCADKHRLLNKLREWELIPKDGEYKCPKCSQDLKLYNDVRKADGWSWRCKNYIQKNKKRQLCDTLVSFRKDTFFERSQLSIFQILGFVNLWVSNASLTLIAGQIEASLKTCVDWSSFCHEVLVEAFLLDEDCSPLGGPGRIVEIDESQFGNRLYHRGEPVNRAWVIGAYERETGRVFMSIVTDRSTAAIVQVIQNRILPGTVIISDCWKAYDGLRDIYDHLKENHSLTFKDPAVGVAAKAAAISYGGRTASRLPGNLARYMFSKRCRLLHVDRTIEFIRYTAKVYNPLRPTVMLPSEELDVYDDDGHLDED